MRTPYERLPIIPTLCAEVVCERPYTGEEISNRHWSGDNVERIEKARQTMTPAQKREFADLVEAKCRYAYANDLEWFLKITRSKTNAGRDQLFIWIAHWLSAYLTNPAIFRRSSGGVK